MFSKLSSDIEEFIFISIFMWKKLLMRIKMDKKCVFKQHSRSPLNETVNRCLGVYASLDNVNTEYPHVHHNLFSSGSPPVNKILYNTFNPNHLSIPRNLPNPAQSDATKAI